MVKALLFGLTILLVAVGLKSASAEICGLCPPVDCDGKMVLDKCGCIKCLGCEGLCTDGFVCVGGKCEPIEGVGISGIAE